INLEPGNYVVNYALMGNPDGPHETVLVGLDVNGLAIPETTIGASASGVGGANGIGGTRAYPQATGSYFLNVPTSSTLQLNARTILVYNQSIVNEILTANN
ncbi:hypothetical protein, partial [Bacillus cereus]|uniref:hypothetical protein n=1 Tax=Bacillus cereus TaxID=1396 RepID=UPI000BEBF931